MTTIHTDTSDKHLHEINRYADSAFPVGIYTVTREGILPDGRGYQDLHWHEELQLTRVECGNLDIRVDGIDYTLHQGEAILINRNLLHVTTNLSENGKYISLNFPDQILDILAEILSLISKDTDAAAPEYQIASRLTVLWSVLVQNMVSVFP